MLKWNCLLRHCDFCMQSNLFRSCYWQVSLLSLSLNTAASAGWAVLPSVSCYKNCQQTCDYKAKTQSSFMVAVQQKILKLLKGSSLQPCVDHSPASSSKTQTRANIVYALSLFAHKLNVALGFRFILKEINHLYVCSCLWPSNRVPTKVEENWWLGTLIWWDTFSFQTCLDFITNIALYSSSDFNSASKKLVINLASFLRIKAAFGLKSEFSDFFQAFLVKWDPRGFHRLK